MSICTNFYPFADTRTKYSFISLIGFQHFLCSCSYFTEFRTKLNARPLPIPQQQRKTNIHVKLLRMKRLSWNVIVTNHWLSQHELTKPAIAVLYDSHTSVIASVPGLYCHPGFYHSELTVVTPILSHVVPAKSAVPVHVMKAYGESRGTSQFILNLGSAMT
jgi:hypothetical protein